jgi:catalase
VVATHKGAIANDDQELTVDRSFLTSSSAEADAVVVAAGTTLPGNPVALTYLQSAYRHHKSIGAWGDGADLLEEAGIESGRPGVVVGMDADGVVDALVNALSVHRHWERAATHPTRLALEA